MRLHRSVNTHIFHLIAVKFHVQRQFVLFTQKQVKNISVFVVEETVEKLKYELCKPPSLTNLKFWDICHNYFYMSSYQGFLPCILSNACKFGTLFFSTCFFSFSDVDCASSEMIAFFLWMSLYLVILRQNK